MTNDEKRGLPRGIGWGIFALAAIFVISVAVSLFNVSHRTSRVVGENLEQFKNGVEDLKNFDTKGAEDKFSSVGGGIKNLNDALGKLGFLFSGAGEAVSGFQEFADRALVLTREVDFFKANFLSKFFGGGGTELLEHAENARSALSEIDSKSRNLVSLAQKFGGGEYFIGDFYLPLQIEAGGFLKFLDNLLAKLKSDSGINLILMFQNPSEMRPTGGFFGSYAEVFIKDGELKSVDVHDINEVDRTITAKVIPPKPLQLITTSWRSADSNWFFDFPASAKKAMDFFESSGLYSGKKSFDAAIAVSPKVITDILSLTGPVELKSRNVVLNSENFLVEIQKIVQDGQAANVTYPKGVLKELADAVLSRLPALGDEQKGAFWKVVGDWISNKDTMVYFKDAGLADFARNYDADGEIYKLSNDFNGDYLAIVDANIGGGKSDLYIKQDVRLESQINLDGTVGNHLIIDRIHEGNKSKYWWYKVLNQDYLQIYLPRSAELTNFKGGLEKKIVPPLDYAKNGYVADPLVLAIESSTEKVFNYPALEVRKDGDKKVFSTWTRTKSGEKSEVIFDYSFRTNLLPADGQGYQFVFEKQAGTKRNYKFQISAPVGFRFRENSLPVFTYESVSTATSTSVLPGRLIFDLTLEKI